ncbi:MAG: hypothetical protein QOC61_2217 [Acidobacteriota bacterium]|jgi:hypothetical protein|nr:hypothetical protein [Acidobacteriota bacterium]
MAVKGKRWKTGRLHWPGGGGRHEQDATSEAARLTPLEETKEFKRSSQRDGDHDADDTIRVDSASVRMPERLIDEEKEGGSIFHLEPVALVILAFMLAFIAFVAWQITLMPEK